MKSFLVLAVLFFSCNSDSAKLGHGNTSINERSQLMPLDSCSDKICQFLSEKKITRDAFFMSIQKDLPMVLTKNYDKYQAITNMNLIFDILKEIDNICTKRDKEFYAYVLWQLTKNENQDGFLVEGYSGVYHNFFNECPEFFYQFANYLNRNDRDSYLSVISMLSFELSNGYDKSYINNVFEVHQRKYNKEKIILEIRDSVLNY